MGEEPQARGVDDLTSPMVSQATESDLSWILSLFAQNSEILGNPLWLKNSYRAKRHRLIVVREIAFAHYRVGKDGLRTLKEIAVSGSHRKQGVGRALIEAIGRPITLKTDADNEGSNRFYKSLSLSLVGQVKTKNGKLMNVYQGW